MANAKKCDRCKGFYELYKGIRGKRNGNLFSVNSARLTSSSIDVCFDLCPACMKETIAFLGLEVVEEVKE